MHLVFAPMGLGFSSTFWQRWKFQECVTVNLVSYWCCKAQNWVYLALAWYVQQSNSINLLEKFEIMSFTDIRNFCLKRIHINLIPISFLFYVIFMLIFEIFHFIQSWTSNIFSTHFSEHEFISPINELFLNLLNSFVHKSSVSYLILQKVYLQLLNR